MKKYYILHHIKSGLNEVVESKNLDVQLIKNAMQSNIVTIHGPFNGGEKIEEIRKNINNYLDKHFPNAKKRAGGSKYGLH